MQDLALRAQLTLDQTDDPAVFGPDELCYHASCFNWALGAGLIGAAPWCQALFNWVSYTERGEHPWRAPNGRPYKTITVCGMQRRAKTALGFLREEHKSELDQITREHCARITGLSREEWKVNAGQLEAQVAQELMALAAKIAGLTPCPKGTPNAVSTC